MKITLSPHEQIQKLCTVNSANEVMQEKQLFEQESEAIYQATVEFHLKVKSMTLGSAMLLWSQQMTKDRMFGERNILLMIELLESGLFPLVRNKASVTLSDLAKQRHEVIIDAIRSHQEWLISKQEDMVNLYVEFASWASKITCGLISTPIDLDKEVTAKRKLPFEKYIHLLSNLSPRERIFAKLYYLGGTRILDDILNIKIEKIDFIKNQIHFDDYSVYYSRHVLNDLSKYIESRKKGFVFINRHGNRINHTVPYRSLKLAAAKIGFSSDFTFKDLVQEA